MAISYFFTTMSSELLDDNVVTYVICIANLNLLDDSVVTYDELTTIFRHFPELKMSSNLFMRQVTINFFTVQSRARGHDAD